MPIVTASRPQTITPLIHGSTQPGTIFKSSLFSPTQLDAIIKGRDKCFHSNGKAIILRQIYSFDGFATLPAATPFQIDDAEWDLILQGESALYRLERDGNLYVRRLAINSREIGRYYTAKVPATNYDYSIKLHYVEGGEPDYEGENPTLILLHGCPLDHMTRFKLTFDELVDAGYHVVAVDLPGMGYSDCFTDVRSYEDFEGTLIPLLNDFVRNVSGEKVVFAGTSYGAALSGMLMSFRQNPSDRAICFGSPGPAASAIGEPVIDKIFDKLLKWSANSFGRRIIAPLLQAATAFVYKDEILQDRYRPHYVEDLLGPYLDDGNRMEHNAILSHRVNEMIYGARTGEYREMLSRIPGGCKVLAVHGEKDGIVAPDLGRRFIEAIKCDTEFRMIPGGHDAAMENPPLYLDMVLEFLVEESGLGFRKTSI